MRIIGREAVLPKSILDKMVVFPLFPSNSHGVHLWIPLDHPPSPFQYGLAPSYLLVKNSYLVPVMSFELQLTHITPPWKYLDDEKNQ